MKGRQYNGPPPLRLRADVTAPNRFDSGWQMTIGAVAERGRRPADDVEVQFRINGKDEGSPISTDEFGRAHLPEMKFEEGNWTIEGQIVGETARFRQVIPLKEDKPKTKAPKSLLVTFDGPDGKQILLISVAAEDGSLIPDFVVSILEKGRITQVKTDKNGWAKHKMNINEEDGRYVEVRAGNGPGLAWRALLLGPKKTKQTALRAS